MATAEYVFKVTGQGWRSLRDQIHFYDWRVHDGVADWFHELR